VNEEGLGVGRPEEADITLSRRDPSIPYTLSPLAKGGKEMGKGGLLLTALLCVLRVRKSHGHDNLMIREF